MIAGVSPVLQALLGTLFTWGLTAAGAALVFVFSSGQKRILDGSLGFAAGVMLAASYWSLLAPAIEMAEDSGRYGDFAFVPVAVGFALGALFVYIADLMMPVLGVGTDPHMAVVLQSDAKLKKKSSMAGLSEEEQLSIRIGRAGVHSDKIENGEVYQRRRGLNTGHTEEHDLSPTAQEVSGQTGSSWRRIVLLILAITIHNIPGESLLVSSYIPPLFMSTCDIRLLSAGKPAQHTVELERDLDKADGMIRLLFNDVQLLKDGRHLQAEQIYRSLASLNLNLSNCPAIEGKWSWFSAQISSVPIWCMYSRSDNGKTPSATFESARNLAVGIGIQNFPEGLAVSLPLRGSGVSTWRSFWYGQLSGMVEPLAGLLGAVAVVLAEPLLPYALAFAAGAMVYVVVDDIIPEAQVSGNGKLASWTSILGFIVMMSLDVGLG
ncbi:zinc transporter ZIP11-like [Sinocyclocheilus rhinocerous]|uniref:zinc transporter ZIP11-like n=1 Tax=Sinocyclocheilus rhinocerous TaxID=307959 RepID=UPI0007BA31CD|nr:PREDICTED: zinc transporter ZIP11-like [Sinocyclocheilus rhinocerous]